jgi:hypothetical protein
LRSPWGLTIVDVVVCKPRERLDEARSGRYDIETG